MLKSPVTAILILISFALISCGENTTEPVSELLMSAEGLVEELGGDCSAVQIRTRSLGMADISSYSKLRIELNGSSDADLSSIQVYYLDNGTNTDIMNLRNRDEINGTKQFEVNAPDHSGDIYLRVTLKSSVCTGQIFFLSLRDVRIYGIR